MGPRKAIQIQGSLRLTVRGGCHDGDADVGCEREVLYIHVQDIEYVRKYLNKRTNIIFHKKRETGVVGYPERHVYQDTPVSVMNRVF